MAIKIHSDCRLEDHVKDSLAKEIEVLKSIPHENLIELKGFENQMPIYKKIGDEWALVKDAFYIVVLQLG